MNSDIETRLKVQDQMIKRQERTISALRKAFQQLSTIVGELHTELAQLRSDEDTVLEVCPRCRGTGKVEVEDYTMVPCPMCSKR